MKSSDIAVVTIDGYGEEAFRRGSLHSGHRIIKVPADQEQAVLRDNPDVIRAMNLLEAKGREFPVVILVDLPDMDKDHEHNFMHVAITRARKLLVLVGDSVTLGSHPWYQRLIDRAAEMVGHRSVYEDPIGIDLV